MKEKSLKVLIFPFLVQIFHKFSFFIAFYKKSEKLKNYGRRFSAGQKIKDKTEMRSSYTGELIFNQCEVPYGALIGKEGDSLQHMMRNLEKDNTKT